MIKSTQKTFEEKEQDPNRKMITSKSKTRQKRSINSKNLKRIIKFQINLDVYLSMSRK